MESRHVLDVVRRYRAIFERYDVPKREWPDYAACPQSEDDVLAHCHWMLDGIERMVREAFERRAHCEIAQERLDRAFRWLGFVQCALWTSGHRTVAEMMEDNGT